MILAVLPMAIAHARFGWEPSQIPLSAALVVGSAVILAITNRKVWVWFFAAGSFFLLIVVVHPTVIFLAPFVGIGVLGRWWRPEEGGMRLVG
ncbi:MAG: hypothetical protein NZL93_02280, partial [Chthoniobacterales bacterium]|nr:hypothetical protein [Chthoniobacterales bacterium]